MNSSSEDRKDLRSGLGDDSKLFSDKSKIRLQNKSDTDARRAFSDLLFH